jgi:hypothetical protein
MSVCFSRRWRLSLVFTTRQWLEIGGLVHRESSAIVVDRSALSDKPPKNIRERWQVLTADNNCRTFRTKSAAVAYCKVIADMTTCTQAIRNLANLSA